MMLKVIKVPIKTSQHPINPDQKVMQSQRTHQRHLKVSKLAWDGKIVPILQMVLNKFHNLTYKRNEESWNSPLENNKVIIGKI